MKRIKLLFITIVLIACMTNIFAQDWRPENRTGVSAETGLMKSLPADGPTPLWSNLELGKGYSSPSFGANTFYITGISGNDDILYALSMDGKIMWKSFGRFRTRRYLRGATISFVHHPYLRMVWFI